MINHYSDCHICSQSFTSQDISKLVTHIRWVHNVHHPACDLRHQSKVHQSAVSSLQANHRNRHTERYRQLLLNSLTLLARAKLTKQDWF